MQFLTSTCFFFFFFFFANCILRRPSGGHIVELNVSSQLMVNSADYLYRPVPICISQELCKCSSRKNKFSECNSVECTLGLTNVISAIWLHQRLHVDQSRAGQKMMKMLIVMMTVMATVISPKVF